MKIDDDRGGRQNGLVDFGTTLCSEETKKQKSAEIHSHKERRLSFGAQRWRLIEESSDQFYRIR